MRVLVTWPPHVPSYFNAGHHLPTFMIAAYLRTYDNEVTAVDAGALNYTWKEFADLVFQGQYDAIVVVNEYDVVEGVRRAVDYSRALSPGALLVTVGRLSFENPDFFRGLDLDAIVASGDYEAGALEALTWAAEGRPWVPGLPGVLVRNADGWQAQSASGTWLPAQEWVLPDVTEIPYAAYDNLYIDDKNKFCGIPQRRELVVPVARGCPVNCSYCDVPAMQGLRERRLSVPRTVDYIRSAFDRLPFEYVAFYAPTFTLDKHWMAEFCTELKAEPRGYPWKCATTLHHLNEGMVADMAGAGCVRISVGVETFEETAAKELPRVKRETRERFERTAAWCNASGVELNCFVIVGLPGSTPEGTQATIDVVRAVGARVRPTLYTPYERMHASMSEREVSAFNRQTFVDTEEIIAGGHQPAEYLSFVFGGDDYVTPATTHIPPLAARTFAS
jgi:anaerobic magnesium-protoporphyrin IX monomethyl ester cyclase